MRVYTCIFEKNGKVKAKDITGPFDRSDAIAVANDKLGLRGSSGKLYAIVPGQHSDRLWIVEDERSKTALRKPVQQGRGPRTCRPDFSMAK